MDLTSPIGIVVSLAVIIAGIILLGGEMSNFIDPASFLLVIVPTIGTLFAAFPFSQMVKVLSHFKIILGRNKSDPVYYIDLMTRMAETARSGGLIALEAQANSESDPFLKTVFQMAADATSAEIIEERLLGSLDAMTKRHVAAWAVYDKGAAFSPAFGMAGTLVGLINMLMKLNFSDAGGAAALGENMAAAMITTLYGSLLANLVFMPLGNKLRARHQEEMMSKEMAVIGILAIVRGDSPRDVRDTLVERLDPKTAAKAGGSK